MGCKVSNFDGLGAVTLHFFTVKNVKFGTATRSPFEISHLTCRPRGGGAILDQWINEIAVFCPAGRPASNDKPIG